MRFDEDGDEPTLILSFFRTKQMRDKYMRFAKCIGFTCQPTEWDGETLDNQWGFVIETYGYFVDIDELMN
jgi:hypothetical protein